MSNPPSSTASSVPKKRAAPSDGDGSATHGPAACLDCRSRKVKCNRQLPECSNCKRSGVPCHFPNPEKKASQMKQLSEDVAQFNDRLSTMEMSLAGRMQELIELVTQSKQDLSSGPARESLIACSPQSFSEPEASDSDEEEDLPDGLDSPAFSHTSGPSNRPSSVIVADGPGERFYGPCSTYSHMLHSKGLVEKLLKAGERPDSASTQGCNSASSLADAGVAKGTTAFSEVRRRYETFSGPAGFQENFETGDERPLELPPRQVLEDSIEDYMSEYRLEPPLFDRQTLARAVVEQYSAEPSELDDSWVLCFNNIILRSAGWKSRAFRFNSFAPKCVDAKVLHLLLGNANRALRQLEKFCTLRLVNIQALILLAFVGRDLIHYNVFARIFDRVCQLAKQMGLHERQNVGNDSSAEDKEAQNVLWILYVVDKQSIFVRGPPCRIYEFECNMQLSSEDTVAQQLVSTNLRLSCLIEEVYRHLYSPKAVKLGVAARHRRIERLDGRLEDLLSRVHTLAGSADKGSVETLMVSHLTYAFYVVRLLVLSHSSAGKSKQTRRDTARAALQTIQSLSEAGFGFDGAVVVLERLFCDHSVIAFHEIFESLMTEGPSSTTTGDLELLKSTTRTLKMIAQSDRPYSYCTRLHKNFVWCTEIAMLVCESRRSSPASPPDRRQSSSSSVNGRNPISHRYSTSLQQRPSQNSSQFSSHRTASSQALGSDVAMQDDLYGPMNMNISTTGLSASGSVATSLNARDAPLTAVDFANLQNSLQPQNFMFTGGADDFDQNGGVIPNQFSTHPSGLSTPIENSARFQEALKYILSVDDGAHLNGNFQQTLADQVPGMLPYSRNMTRPNT